MYITKYVKSDLKKKLVFVLHYCFFFFYSL